MQRTSGGKLSLFLKYRLTGKGFLALFTEDYPPEEDMRRKVWGINPEEYRTLKMIYFGKELPGERLSQNVLGSLVGMKFLTYDYRDFCGLFNQLPDSNLAHILRNYTLIVTGQSKTTRRLDATIDMLLKQYKIVGYYKVPEEHEGMLKKARISQLDRDKILAIDEAIQIFHNTGITLMEPDYKFTEYPMVDKEDIEYATEALREVIPVHEIALKILTWLHYAPIAELTLS